MRSIKVNVKELFHIIVMLIILFITVQPPSLIFTSYHMLYRIAQIGTLFLGILIGFRLKLKTEISRYYLYVFIYFFIFLIITYYNNGLTNRVISNFIPIFALITTLSISIKKNSYLTIKSLYLYFSLTIYINFVFLILHPEGLIETDRGGMYHFLGHTNQMGSYFLIAATITLIKLCMEKRKLDLSSVILNVIIYISLLKVWSATSIFWITIFYFIALINTERKWLLASIFTPAKVSLIIISQHLLIVVFRVQELFTFMITQVLNKDLTLTGRTRIWDYSFFEIFNSFLFGYGDSGGIYITVGTAYFDAHNIFLQILLQGGVVLLIAFLLILKLSLTQIKGKKNIKLERILLSSVLILFSMMITEVYSYLTIFLLLFLVYSNNYLQDSKR